MVTKVGKVFLEFRFLFFRISLDLFCYEMGNSLQTLRLHPSVFWQNWQCAQENIQYFWMVMHVWMCMVFQISLKWCKQETAMDTCVDRWYLKILSMPTQTVSTAWKSHITNVNTLLVTHIFLIYFCGTMPFLSILFPVYHITCKYCLVLLVFHARKHYNYRW